MAAGLNATKANSFLDNIGNAGSVASVTGIFIKLHTGDPGSAGTANAASETARQSASFAAASAGSMATDATMTWTSVAATETFSHISAWDHTSAGTFLFSDALASSRAVTAGDNFAINSGNLTLSITPLAA